MRTVRDSRTGTSYQARRRGVSNGSIRKALDAAERVLRDAKMRGVLVGEVPALKSAAPKADTLILGDLRVSELCGLAARASTLRVAACASRDRQRSPMPANATSRSCRRCAKA